MVADSKRVSVSRDFLEKLIALRQEGEDLLWKAQQYLDSQD